MRFGSSVSGICFCVSAPDNKNIADEGTGVSNSGTWNLATALQQCSGVFLCGVKVEIVASRLSYKTTEYVEFASRSGCSRKGVTITRKR